MSIDYITLKNVLIGRSVPKSPSGTLSGHAAGEPFDKLVYQILKEEHPEKVFRQYEYLNMLYASNPEVTGYEPRVQLFDSACLSHLLCRGKDTTIKWKPDNQFLEKQDDTADILFVNDDFFELIDVKTRNNDKRAQAPNIISALKVATACKHMLDNNDFTRFTITYIEVDWTLEGDNLVCTHVSHSNLFKANPDTLYINWAAAMQIQFHVCDLDQSFEGDVKAWSKAYLKHFVNLA